MTSVVVLLFVLGAVFMFFEVFTPGPLFGILGAVTFLFGILVAMGAYGEGAGLIAGLIAVALVGATLYAELVWLPKTRFAKRFSVQGTSGTTIKQIDAEADTVVGKTAEALTTLAPSGYVSVEGKRFEAFCQSGHADKGAQLRVTGLDNFRLIVTKT